MHANTSLSARSRAQVTATNISFTYGDSPVFSGVTLSIGPDSRIGLVGENGRGKSTLLDVLSGEKTPTSGTVERHGTLAVAAQELTAPETQTVQDLVDESLAEAEKALAELDAAAEGLALGDDDQRYARALDAVEAMDAWGAEHRLEVAYEKFAPDVKRTTLLSALSVGQRYRVRLACLLGSDADFLFLDEPTNHLDAAGLNFLTESIGERRGGVVIVSHDRALLQDVVDIFVDLDPSDDGNVRVYGGGYDGFRRGREAERERWKQTYERQMSKRAFLDEALVKAQNRQIDGWRPGKGTGKHTRSTRVAGLVQTVRRRQEDLEHAAVSAPPPPKKFALPDLGNPQRTAILTVKEASYEPRLSKPVDLRLCRGDKIVVTGPNGAGKSTLLSLLSGDLQPTAGQVNLHSGARVAQVAQETSLPPHARVGVECERAELRAEEQGVAPADPRDTGLLNDIAPGQRIDELSMGQQRRVEIALALISRPDALLLDEPTNHVSAALVDELTQAFDKTPAAIVLTTHDRQLLRDLGSWNRIQLA